MIFKINTIRNLMKNWIKETIYKMIKYVKYLKKTKIKVF